MTRRSFTNQYLRLAGAQIVCFLRRRVRRRIRVEEFLFYTRVQPRAIHHSLDGSIMLIVCVQVRIIHI